MNRALLYTHKDIRIGLCPLMVRWSSTFLFITILLVWILLPQTSHSANLINGLGGSVGFGENAHTRNDDTPTGAIDITSVFPSGVKFGANTYTTMYINNNGMVTFGTAVSSFTPNGLSAGVSNGSGGFVPAIALFWSDLDTRTTSVTSTGGNSTGSNLVYWDLDTVNKNITITWDDVAEFSSGTVAVISGQIVLHDAGSGDMDIKFIYQYAGTLATHTVTAGWNAGVTNGVAGTDYFEIPNMTGTTAGQYNVLSDLASRAGNAGQSGIWTFSLRSGGVIPVTTPMVNSIAPVASGTALYGQTLSTTDGTWTGANHPPVTFTYQWYRASSNLGANAAAIAGATSSSYVIQAADSTKYLRATVIGHDGSDTLSANSNWIGPVPDNSVLAAVISNGTATPTSYSVLPGVTGSYTFDFATSANYHMTGINNGCGGTAVPSDFTYTNNTVGVTSARLTFSNTINTSCTVTASTALNASTITSSSTDNNDAAGVGGSISCPAIANYGTNPSCSFTPATGYHVYDVVVDGSSAWNNYSTSGVNTTQSSWSLGVTTAARTILVKFRKNTYLVTVIPGTNGSMSPATSYFDYGILQQLPWRATPVTMSQPSAEPAVRHTTTQPLTITS